MTHNEAAQRLLAYFPPEERGIPDSATYPGRNAAVAGALNAALQLVFKKGGPWVRKDDRGALVHEPTTVTLSVTAGSTSAAVTSGWQDWMSGCTIAIDGEEIDNRIRSLNNSGRASATINPAGTNNTIVLTARTSGSIGNSISIEITEGTYDGTLEIQVAGSAIVVVPLKKIRVSGTLTDGTNPVVFPDLLPAEESGHFSSTGSLDIPASGTWYGADKAGAGPIWWELRKFVDNALIASWESTDNVDDPAYASWTPVSPATGTPTLSQVITTTAAQVIDAINASEEAGALVTAAASGGSTGVVAAVAETHLSGGNDNASLKYPYGGTTGSKNAVVYCDSITLADDVLELSGAVKFNGHPLDETPAEGGGSASSFRDYGSRAYRDVTPDTERVSSGAGFPGTYAVETWNPDATAAPRLRLILSPAPAAAGALGYKVLMTPPSITSLSSTSALPVPFGYEESVFLPIAVMQLFDSPFFRGVNVPDAVTAKYREALETLESLKPNKAGPRFVIRG